MREMQGWQGGRFGEIDSGEDYQIMKGYKNINEMSLPSMFVEISVIDSDM